MCGQINKIDRNEKVGKIVIDSNIRSFKIGGDCGGGGCLNYDWNDGLNYDWNDYMRTMINIQDYI
jgi:hypothetical protein